MSWLTSSWKEDELVHCTEPQTVFTAANGSCALRYVRVTTANAPERIRVSEDVVQSKETYHHHREEPKRGQSWFPRLLKSLRHPRSQRRIGLHLRMNVIRIALFAFRQRSGLLSTPKPNTGPRGPILCQILLQTLHRMVTFYLCHLQRHNPLLPRLTA